MRGPRRMRLREPDAWAAETYGRALEGGRQAALSIARQARGVG